jgi:arylsulfatase A-like enzyme
LDETIVVLMSDHGEGLRTDPRLPDHHGQLVYNSLVHVPLAVRVPGVEPRTVAEPVSLIDLYPTLIELTGGTPSPLTDGLSLVPHLLETEPGASAEPRALPLNEVEQVGVVQWPYKLLVRLEDGFTEVYDLSTDWDEQHDMAREDPELALRLRASYDKLPRVVVDRTRKAWRTREATARKP